MGNKCPRTKSTKVLAKRRNYGGSFEGRSISVSAKRKSAGPSFKRGKDKVSTGDHKSQKKKRSILEWSPSDINFKRVHYDHPDHSDDSDPGNDVGFKELSITDFHEDTLCPQDISVLESIDASEMTTTSIAQEEQDSLVTAIIPRQVTPDNLVETTPLKIVPTGIRSLFVNSIQDWVQRASLTG